MKSTASHQGTVSVFQVTLHAKMAMPDLQRYPLNLNLIKNVEETVIFLTRKMFVSVSFSLLLKNKECASHFGRQPAIEKEQKH